MKKFQLRLSRDNLFQKTISNCLDQAKSFIQNNGPENYRGVIVNTTRIMEAAIITMRSITIDEIRHIETLFNDDYPSKRDVPHKAIEVSTRFTAFLKIVKGRIEFYHQTDYPIRVLAHFAIFKLNSLDGENIIIALQEANKIKLGNKTTLSKYAGREM